MQTNHSITAVRDHRAFSLLELLVVVSIIAILVSLLMPSLAKAKQRAQRIFCVNNLKQIGTAYQVFSTDHGGKFPMQVPMVGGGTLELTALRRGMFMDSHRQLQVLSNEIQNPKVLVCPTDRRVSATNFPRLTITNTSYLVNAQTIQGDPDSVLSLDRNFVLAQTNMSTLAGAQQIRALIRWTAEMHGRMGNILYSDIHVDLSKDHAVVKANPSFGVNPGGMPSGPGGRGQGSSGYAGAPGKDGKGTPERTGASPPSGRMASSSSGVSPVMARNGGAAAAPEKIVESESFHPTPVVQTEATTASEPLDENDVRHRLIALIATAGYFISLLIALIVLLIAYLRARKRSAAAAPQPSFD